MGAFKKLALGVAAVTTGGALAFLSAQPKIANPRSLHCIWTPGDYSNFVVLTSTDLVNWEKYLETADTNFQFNTDKPKRFFEIYGTNSDGASAWAGSKQ